MLIIAGAVIGAIIGDRRAAGRGGSRADRAQYAAVHAILLALAGLIATIVLGRVAG